jgi:signal transduction histidine kinase
MLLLLAAAGTWLIRHNRRLFERVTALSDRRRELAQQLISMQESIFRSVSRELHDEFGQILTAVGAMLDRAGRLADSNPSAARAELTEVHQVVQSTLEKVRELSQALHPVMLEEVGLEGALDAYIPLFERRTGIAVRFSKPGGAPNVSADQAVHIYRVLQEALNNVARHSGAAHAEVRLAPAHGVVTLEVEDAGAGFRDHRRDGLGLVSMRERAEMAGGRIEYLPGKDRGVLVRLTVPAAAEEEHVPKDA